MTPRYPYASMVVTGYLHLVLGFASIFNAIIGLSAAKDFFGFSVSALLQGIWILLVGHLGTEAGRQMNEDVRIRKLILLNESSGPSAEWEGLAAEKIRQFKSAYMMTAILSASFFSTMGFAISMTFLFAEGFRENNIYHTSNLILASEGIAISILEFILAIVSSIICCRYSSMNTTTIVQAPIQQIVTTIPGKSRTQYQVLPNTTRECLKPFNTMQNQPPDYVAVLLNSPTYQNCDDPKNPKQ